MKQTQSFENYLADIHAKDYHGFDDDMPDAFEAWVVELDVAKVMELAQKWGDKIIRELKKEIVDELDSIEKSVKTI